MAINTIYTYPLNGSNAEFHIPFEYLARKFVVITLIGTDRRELVLTEDYRFTTRAHIKTNRVWGPADGYERIEVRRLTSATERLVDFSDGSILRASELNISQVQTLHVAEEARNMVADTIAENADGDLDARGRRLVNLADAVSPDHAVTLRQEMAWAEGALNSRNAAASSQQQALASENAAKLSEANTKASENAAKLSEANTKASENAAKLSETNSKASENAAKLSETNSKASEQAAAASAAAVNLPPVKGPRYILASGQNDAGLEYRFRVPSGRRDSSGETLLQVGSFGLGGIAVPLSGASANTLNETGFFYMNGGSDCPVPSFYGWILNIEVTPGEYTYQFAFDVSGGAYRRARNVTWGSWAPDYTGLNVNSTIRGFMASVSQAEARASIGAAEKKTRGYTFEQLWKASEPGGSSVNSNQAFPMYYAGDSRVLSQQVKAGDTLLAGFCNTNSPAHTAMSLPFMVTGLTANVGTSYGPAGEEVLTFSYVDGGAYLGLSLASDKRTVTVRTGSGGWRLTSIYRGLIEA